VEDDHQPLARKHPTAFLRQSRVEDDQVLEEEEWGQVLPV